MKPSETLRLHLEQVRCIVAAHHASNACVSGSVLRGDDEEGSDLDILIDPTPETTLMDIGAIRHELRTLLTVDVDVVAPRGLQAWARMQLLSEVTSL